MQKFLFIILFVIFIISSYFYLNFDKNEKIELYLNETTQKQIQNYKVLYNKYEKISNIIFKTNIDIPEVKEIFKNAKDANSDEQKIIREKLYLKLKDTYSFLKNYNIKQLHFHLPNNNSFLRFHKPNKFGDNLTDIRATVKYVNESKKYISGFEEGRIYNGYRFVFPLNYNNEHLGSVEVSFSTLSMSLELIDNYSIPSKFLILKDIVKAKLFESELGNYVESKFNDFYYEKGADEIMQRHQKKSSNCNISKATKDYLKKHFKDKESFSIYDKNIDCVMTFLQIKNPISHEVVGVFVLLNSSMFIKNQENHFFTVFFVTIFSIGLLLLFIYKLVNEREFLRKAISDKTKKLQDSNETLAKYLKLIDKNVITSTTDNEGIIIYASEAFCKISGYTKEELIGKAHNIIRHEDMEQDFFKELWKSIQNNKTWKGEIKNRRKDGTSYWVKTTISANFDENGEKTGYTAIREDISDRKTIEKISRTDALTNIYNRRFFNEIFPIMLANANRNRHYLCFIILDIDYFKQYNDTYGHQKGDEVLIAVANAIKNSLNRADDFCFRIGGEEFGVLFLTEDFENACNFANKIRENIKNLKIEHSKNSASNYVTASMGMIYNSYENKTTIDEIYRKADQYLYEAKESGRDKVVCSILSTN